VQTKLILRNAVCSEGVSPKAFGVERFGKILDLGEPKNQMLLKDAAVTEWEQVLLQVLPERLQVGFKESASADLVRRAIEDLVARKDELAPEASLELNAGLQLTMDGDETDPSASLINVDDLAALLGGNRGGRGGITLVFNDQLSRWWIELTPNPDRDRIWVYDFNRLFKNFPAPGDARAEIIDWFATVEEALLAQFETISSGADS
jgi:hypothetical protein